MTILSILLALFFNAAQPVNMAVDRNEDPTTVVGQEPRESQCETEFIIPEDGNF